MTGPAHMPTTAREDPPAGGRSPVAPRPTGIAGPALPARRSVLVAALAMAVVADAVVVTKVDGVAGSLAIAAAVAGLVFSRRLRTPTAAAIACSATAFGVLLVVRTSWWLVAPLVVGAGSTLVLGASFSGGGDARRQRWRDVPRRAGRFVLALAFAPGLLAASARELAPRSRSAGRLLPLLRGVAIAAPVVLVIGMLLRSADAVFASLLVMPADADVWVARAFEVVLLMVPAGALLHDAGQPAHQEEAPSPRPARGAPEAVVVLAALVALLGSFAAVQLVVLLGGADVVLRTHGLTRAEHARQGFFQLVAVSAIVAVVLLVVRATVRPGSSARRRFVVLGELAVGLTLVVVISAVHRMVLYEDAFGLSALRFAVFAAAGWIAVVFVLIGIAVARPEPERDWLPSAVVASILAVPLVLGVVDPDRMIASRNIDRHLGGADLDATYLAKLSDDAAPAILDRWTSLQPDDQEGFRIVYCNRPAPDDRWLAWNASRSGADDLRAVVCDR